jgi:hypothetical protein
MAQPLDLALDPALVAAAQVSRAWPFEEARRLIKRLDGLKGAADKTVIFETGYGRPGCRTSAPSARSRARAWFAMPSRC